MKKDFVGALFLIGIFVFIAATGVRAPEFLQIMQGSRQLSTVFILGLVAYTYMSGYHLTALVGGLLSVYLLRTFWTTWPRSDASRLYVDVATDNARFNPATSIDLQFANKTVTHNLPVLLVKPLFLDMLTFPPSAETLTELSG
jgi:hypothetical protein